MATVTSQTEPTSLPWDESEAVLIIILFFCVIIIIKNEKIRVILCKNAAGALYIVNKMCVDGHRNVQG